jgi:hypothetical protein
MEKPIGMTSLPLFGALRIMALPFALNVSTAQPLPPTPSYKFEVAVIKPSDLESSVVWLSRKLTAVSVDRMSLFGS